MSLRLRIAAIAGIAVALTVIGVAAGVYAAVRANLRGEVEDALELRAQAFGRSRAARPPFPGPGERPGRPGAPPPGPRGGKRWLPRYFVRRVGWHVLDHALEIEDRAR